MEDFLQIGVVTTTHGVHGEVKVFPTTDDPKRFKRLKEVLIETKAGKMKLKPEGVKFFKNMVIVKFEGYDTPEAVNGFKQCSLYVTRENAVKLSKDEYFIADLIGLKVFDDEKQTFGVVTDVIQTGANDVYVIGRENGEEVLIPAIKDCILEVNVAEGYMNIHVMEGLI